VIEELLDVQEEAIMTTF